MYQMSKEEYLKFLWEFRYNRVLSVIETKDLFLIERYLSVLVYFKEVAQNRGVQGQVEVEQEMIDILINYI